MQVISLLKIGQYSVLPQEFTVQFELNEKTTLQPKFVDLLVYLAKHYPRIVSRQELIDNVWDGNFYVGEKALTNAIWHLRNTFKTYDNNQEMIETIRKTGYRLLVEPEIIVQQPTLIEANHTAELSKINRSRRILSAIPYVSILLLLVTFYWFYSNSSLPTKQITIETVTTEPGVELFVAISPNGRFIAYQRSNQEDEFDLFMQDLNQPDVPPRQLTFDDAVERHSVWSNDGKYLFFSRRDSNRKFCDYIQLDISNFFEKKVAKCPLDGGYNYLDISADDRLLAFHGDDDQSDESGIYFVDLTQDNAVPMRFSCAVNCGYKDRDVAFAPDGKRLAITRRYNSHTEDIYLVNIETGKSERITEGEEDIVGISWHRDNLQLAYGVRKAEIRAGFLVNTTTLERHALNLEGFSYPAFNKIDNTLFYQQKLGKYLVKSLSLDQSIASSPDPILLSGYSIRQPDYSATSKKIAYVSNETGLYQLWLSNAQGKEREQLTNMETNISYPRWSHDGKKLAFLAPYENQDGFEIYIIDIHSKQISVLKTPYQNHDRPSWSFNDDAIISAISDKGQTDLYLIPINADQPKRITFDGGRFGIMTAKNQLLYTRDENGLWQKDISNDALRSPSISVIDPQYLRKAYSWAYTEKGIYYRENIRHHQQISFFEFSSKKIIPLAKLPKNSFAPSNTLSVNLDDNKIIFAVKEYYQSDIKKLHHPLFN